MLASAQGVSFYDMHGVNAGKRGGENQANVYKVRRKSSRTARKQNEVDLEKFV